MQAPSKPSTPYGEMMAYYLEMEPSLFDSAVESQFAKLKEERERRDRGSDTEGDAAAPASESTDLVLSGLQDRIQKVAEKERRATVEDLMYL